MHVNVDTDKIEIDVPEADEWVERIGKTAYEMCNNDHIKLKTWKLVDVPVLSQNLLLGSTGVEKHLNEIPSKLRPTFQEILDDVKSRKELEIP